MEKVITKRPLSTEGVPPLISDRAEAMRIFGELLRRGQSLYPSSHDPSEGYPRVYRIVALKER